MKIGFNGLPLFTHELTQALSEVDAENKYVFYNTYEDLLAKVKLKLRASSLDGFVSFKGVSEPSKSLDLVLSKKIPLIMFWHGTEVSIALERFRNGSIEWKFIKYAKHYSDAPWLIEELKTLGINAELLRFKHLKGGFIREHFDYESFKVLSYVGDERESFYGFEHVLKLAQEFPDVEFTIVGTKREFDILPSNVISLGWVEKSKMNNLMQSHAVLLRLTEHDGNAQMVIEALANGMEVIWTQNHRLTHKWNGTDRLTSLLNKLREKVVKRGKKSNIENAKEIRELNNSQNVLSTFIDKLKQNFGA